MAFCKSWRLQQLLQLLCLSSRSFAANQAGAVQALGEQIEAIAPCGAERSLVCTWKGRTSQMSSLRSFAAIKNSRGLIVSVANVQYASGAIEWAKRLENKGISDYIIGAADLPSFFRFARAGVSSCYDSCTATNFAAAFAREFGSRLRYLVRGKHSCVGWRQVNFAKTGLLSLLAEHTDVDIFFADLDWDLQRNPFPEMRALGVDLAYYKDATWVREPACDQGAYHS